MKLFHKLTLGFLAVIVLGSVNGFLAMDYSKSLLQQTYIDSTESMAQKVLDDVSREIDYNVALFQAYSHDVSLQNEVDKSNIKFSNLLLS